MARYLSKEGLKHFVEKVIGKTDISAVGDGTLKGAISSLKYSLDSIAGYVEGNGKQISGLSKEVASNYNELLGKINANTTSIQQTKDALNTTNKKVSNMNYAIISQIEGTAENVSIAAEKTGSVTIQLPHNADMSYVGCSSINVSSKYVVLSGWNRNTASSIVDEFTVYLYNTTSSTKTVNVKVEGRYVKDKSS